jgi:hypothetical protein
MIRRGLILLFALAVSSCAFQRAEDANRAKTELQGMSSERILACMGIPARKQTEGATEVWEYDSGNGERTAFGTATASGNYAFGTAVSERRFCRVDVVLSMGHVQAVNYSGPTGGLLTKGEQCAYVTANCLHH